MGLRVSIIVLFLYSRPLFSLAQEVRNSPAIYGSIPQVSFVTGDNPADKIGVYEMSWGLSGSILTLDSAMHFYIQDYQCIGGGIRDSGQWFVYPTGRIGLRSTHGLQTFDLVRFHQFSFCIAPEKRIAFVSDFKKAFSEYKSMQPTKYGGKIMTTADGIAARLMEDYYVRGVRIRDANWHK